MTDDSKRIPTVGEHTQRIRVDTTSSNKIFSGIVERLRQAQEEDATLEGVALTQGTYPNTLPGTSSPNTLLAELEHKPLASKYSLASIVDELIPRLEEKRQSLLATEGDSESYFYPRKVECRKEKYNFVVTNYLNELEIQFQHELDGRREGSPERKYLNGVSQMLQKEFASAYAAIARRRDNAEKSFWYKFSYGNRYAVTAAAALPGLATLRMPYSTPIVMGALGFVGYKYLHPFIQRKRNEDLENLIDFTVHRQKAIVEEARGKREQKQSFELPSMMKDLVPALELARIDGKGEKDFQGIVNNYLGKLHQDFMGKLNSEQHSDYAKIPGWLNEAYFTQLAGIVQEEFLPRFERYAASQNRKEEHGLWYKMLSNKWVGATLTAGLLTPIYFATTRVLPFGGLDDVLMAGLFAVGGYHLPKLINPEQESLPRVYCDICARQEDLDGKIRK